MPRLRAPLQQQLDEPLAELEVQRLWRDVRAPAESIWERRRLPLSAAGTGLALGVVLGLLLRPTAPQPARAATEPAYVAQLGARLSNDQATRLMREAVHARQQEDLPRAVTLLEHVRAGASGSAHAALAGWTLARMRLPTDPKRAALDIQRALQDHLPEGLQETVRAKLVEAHALAGANNAARAAARAYRAAYPEGRYLSDVARWTDKLFIR